MANTIKRQEEKEYVLVLWPADKPHEFATPNRADFAQIDYVPRKSTELLHEQVEELHDLLVKANIPLKGSFLERIATLIKQRDDALGAYNLAREGNAKLAAQLDDEKRRNAQLVERALLVQAAHDMLDRYRVSRINPKGYPWTLDQRIELAMETLRWPGKPEGGASEPCVCHYFPVFNDSSSVGKCIRCGQEMRLDGGTKTP